MFKKLCFILILCILAFKCLAHEDDFEDISQQLNEFIEFMTPEVICDYDTENCELEDSNVNDSLFEEENDEEEREEIEEMFDYPDQDYLPVSDIFKTQYFKEETVFHDPISNSQDVNTDKDYQAIDERNQFIQNDPIEVYPTDTECFVAEQENRINYIKKVRQNSKKRKILRKKKKHIKLLKNCCIKGKKIGNRPKVYDSDNLFHACRKLSRFHYPTLSQHCRWAINNCCENKALRRFYIKHKGNK
ncbi:uncharacterized protein [Centruroides vittatus]|uniref:uncharacterized protein isoform X2 n=1 Tax=Centruroides vittatus TaxID=120091 RepID=UPI0035100DE0